MYKLLIVDDDNSIRRFLELSLEEYSEPQHIHKYKVFTAENGEQALIQMSHNPDLILLDLNLPDISGYDLLKIIKAKYSSAVIMLSVEDSNEEKVKMLDAGADDYINKPFNLGELLARIRVCLRHYKPSENKLITAFDLKIDLGLKLVTKRDKIVKLSATEFAILSLLALNQEKLVSQEEILKSIWGLADKENSHYLRIYINHLRKKLETNPSKPEIIITEAGLGYRLLK